MDAAKQNAESENASNYMHQNEEELAPALLRTTTTETMEMRPVVIRNCIDIYSTTTYKVQKHEVNNPFLFVYWDIFTSYSCSFLAA